MKNKIIFLIIATCVLFVNLSLAEEINFESNEIDILNKGELIKAKGNVKAIISGGLTISGDSSEYNKKKLILSITGNVSVDDKEKNIFLKTDQIIYNVENETIITKGKTISKIDNNYEIIGSELFHDRLGMIFSLRALIIDCIELIFKDTFLVSIAAQMVLSLIILKTMLFFSCLIFSS